MAWTMLDSTKLTGTSDTITVSGFDAKAYLFVLLSIQGTGNVHADITYNNDATANYAYQHSRNGGTGNGINLSNIPIAVTSVQYQFCTLYIVNASDREKLQISMCSQTAGTTSSTAPDRTEVVGKWINTSDSITRIDSTNSEAGNDYNTGSEMIVFGSD